LRRQPEAHDNTCVTPLTSPSTAGYEMFSLLGRELGLKPR